MTTYDMGPPPTNGAGPVVRSHAGPERMAAIQAEIAAQERAQADRLRRATEERAARLAAREAARAAKQEEDPVPRGPDGPEARDRRAQRRAAKAALILPAIRETATYLEAAVRLGTTKYALEKFVAELRQRGELPQDVAELLRARARAGTRSTAPRAATEAALEEAGPRPGKAAAKPAHIVSTDLTLEGGEEGAPATAATTAEAGSPPAEEVVLPPPSPPKPIEGEDRCPFGQHLGGRAVVVCDRADGHAGTHRGRLIRVGSVSETFVVLGHAAVAG